MSGFLRNLVESSNAERVPLAAVPRLDLGTFQHAVLEGARSGLRVAALFAMDASTRRGVDLVVVLADDRRGTLLSAVAGVDGGAFSSMVEDCPQVHLFEREIAEQFCLRPEGHPWMKPVRFAPPFPLPSGEPRMPGAERPAIGVVDFHRVEGESVHEVAVGPVHAGVIEPGHFRFQCHGEHVFHLEISLGYQHRGVEEAAIGGPHPITIHHMETASGDASIAHAWAYSQAIEALGGREAPPRAQALRAIALELERLACHTGDLGALANDVGYLPTAAYCGRIRGDFLNLTAAICGNRFGRSLVAPGGTRFDLDARARNELLERLAAVERDVGGAVDLLWLTPSVMARFEHVAAIRAQTCRDLGVVGMAARACGLAIDVRCTHPTGPYREAPIDVATAPGGDVNARAQVRRLEIRRSIAYVRQLLSSLPEGEVRCAPPALTPDSLVVSLVEGWRGEVCHVAVTGSDGRFRRYKVVDASFHNWTALAMALRDEQISDFPLANKSFNLSYSGFDL